MAHSVYELNLCRRELIRPDLNDQYRQLCNSQTPISKLLFGDDLLKVVKDITESNKVSQNFERTEVIQSMDEMLSRDKGRIQTVNSHFLYIGQSQRTEAALRKRVRTDQFEHSK